MRSLTLLPAALHDSSLAATRATQPSAVILFKYTRGVLPTKSTMLSTIGGRSVGVGVLVLVVTVAVSTVLVTIA